MIVQISHYKVTAKIGEGGMGVVYKAEDTKLERTVALKFLAPHLLEDEEARKRFHREAKAAARLSHPNICTVHEISEERGQTFLVMELIEGESLDKKIERGPLSLKEALGFARQVADGLAAGHAKGVVHRDIKPRNLIVTPEGRVKILDFGLALLTEGSKLTKFDTMAGTVAYMSPEQAQGMEVDSRTDLWALGCVLYEMVRGQRPFQGVYHQALVYEIVNQEPEPLTGVRTGVPMELEWIVGKCLAKDREDRYNHAEDMVLDLRTLAEKLKSGGSTILRTGVGAQRAVPAPPHAVEAGAQHAEPLQGSAEVRVQAGVASQQTAAPVVAAEEMVPKRKLRLPWAVATVAALVALAVWFLYFHQTAPETPLRRFAFTPPEPVAASASFDTNVAISPNGKHIAFIAGDEDRKLWVQDLDQRQPRVIDATEGAVNPFWSPGSDFIGFAAARELKKVSVKGGPVIRLCEMPSRLFVGGSWSPDSDSVVFSSGLPALYEVPARGGSPKLLISPEPSEPSPGEASVGLTGEIFSPHFLPSEAGERVLVFAFGTASGSTMMVQDLKTGRRELLGPGAVPFYSPSGHLVYQSDLLTHDLLALPFSLDTLKAAGEAFPISENSRDPTVAADGTLVYLDSYRSDQQERLAWRNRSGEWLQAAGRPHRRIHSFDMSPDGRQAVVSVDGNIYVEDLERGVSTQLTFTAEPEGYPVWAPWGAVFGHQVPELFFRPLDLSRDVETLVGGAEGNLWAYDVDPGGRNILYGVLSPASEGGVINYDILRLERSSDGTLSEPKVFFADPFETVDAQISPDGRYVAYSSRGVTDRWDVFVQPFPDGGPQVQVTPEGGAQVRWNPNRKELFFVSGDTLYAVEVTAQPEFRPGRPRALFSNGALRRGTARPRYDVAAGGDRFLLAEPDAGEEGLQPEIHIVENWYEEFRDREQD